MLSFTSILWMCNPSKWIDVILVSSKTTGSTRMLKVNEKRKMRLTDYVLLRSSQSNSHSVSQDFHVMKHRSDYVSASSYFLFFCSIPKSCRDCLWSNAIFASWYPVLCDKGGVCLFSSTRRKYSRLWFLLLCSFHALCGMSFFCNMGQSISPKYPTS